MNAHEVIRQFPHCDPRVLHEPGQCEFCDRRPEWQALRIVWGIKFTGKDSRPTGGISEPLLPCPAEFARGNQCQAWCGNQPSTPQPPSSSATADTGSNQSAIPADVPTIDVTNSTRLWTICPHHKCTGRTPWVRQGKALISPNNCITCRLPFPVVDYQIDRVNDNPPTILDHLSGSQDVHS